MLKRIKMDVLKLLYKYGYFKSRLVNLIYMS